MQQHLSHRTLHSLHNYLKIRVSKPWNASFVLQFDLVKRYERAQPPRTNVRIWLASASILVAEGSVRTRAEPRDSTRAVERDTLPTVERSECRHYISYAY